jgi:hypothetical protein
MSAHPKLITRGFDEFLSYEYPPMEYLLNPVLPRQGTMMIAGYRGIGKSFLAQSAAYAIATGVELLDWDAPNPTGVLYVDGEMHSGECQARFRAIHNTLRARARRQPNEALRILSAMENQFGIPDLADPTDDKGRRMIEEALASCEVLFLDNLSVLCRSGVENDAESWGVMQGWLLSLRSRGKTVVILHHGGKPDRRGRSAQRGTSKREDILTASLMLQPLASQRDKREAGFVIECTKLRGGAMPAPLPVTLDYAVGRHCELVVSVNADDKAPMAAHLYAEGHSQETIAKQLGVDQSTVSRWLRKHGAQCKDQSEPE